MMKPSMFRITGNYPEYEFLHALGLIPDRDSKEHYHEFYWTVDQDTLSAIRDLSFETNGKVKIKWSTV